MSAQDYFYRDKAGREIGPLSLDVLAKFRLAGVLDGETLVRAADSAEWKPLCGVLDDVADTQKVSRAILAEPASGDTVAGKNRWVFIAVIALAIIAGLVYSRRAEIHPTENSATSATNQTSLNREVFNKVAELASAANGLEFPDMYGVYALDNGRYFALGGHTNKPPRLTPSAIFVIFDRKVVGGYSNPSETITLHDRLFVRKQLTENVIDSALIRVTDAKMFAPNKEKISLKYGPVTGQSEMIRAIPESPLPKGLYFLRVEDNYCPFAIGASEDEGKLVDQLVQMMDNKVFQNDFLEPNALKPKAEAWKKAVLKSLDENRLIESVGRARRYVEFDDSESELPRLVATHLLGLAKKASGSNRWPEAAVLSGVAAKLNLPESETLHQESIRQVENWNRLMRDENGERTKTAMQATVTNWVGGMIQTVTHGRTRDERQRPVKAATVSDTNLVCEREDGTSFSIPLEKVSSISKPTQIGTGKLPDFTVFIFNEAIKVDGRVRERDTHIFRFKQTESCDQFVDAVNTALKRLRSNSGQAQQQDASLVYTNRVFFFPRMQPEGFSFDFPSLRHQHDSTKILRIKNLSLTDVSIAGEYEDGTDFSIWFGRISRLSSKEFRTNSVVQIDAAVGDKVLENDSSSFSFVQAEQRDQFFSALENGVKKFRMVHALGTASVNIEEYGFTCKIRALPSAFTPAINLPGEWQIEFIFPPAFGFYFWTPSALKETVYSADDFLGEKSFMRKRFKDFNRTGESFRIRGSENGFMKDELQITLRLP